MVARAATRCCSSARQDCCARGTASPTAGGGVRQALWIAVFGGATVAALPRAVLREPSRGLPRRRRWGCPQGVRRSGSFIRRGESCRGSCDSQVARRHEPRSAMSPTRTIKSSRLAHSMIQSPVSPRNGRRDSHERDRTVAGTSGSAGTVGRGDSHAAPYRDDRKAAPVGPEPVGAGTSVCGGGVRHAVMVRGVRRRDGRRVAAGRVAAEPEPAFRYGPRPVTGPTRRAAARTVRYCIAVRNAGGMAKAARTVESIAAQTAIAVIWGARWSGMYSVPPVSRPAGHHATRRPSGVTAPRCRRLVRSARRRRRTR